MTASGMDSRTSLSDNGLTLTRIQKISVYNETKKEKVTAGERLYDKTCVCMCGIGIRDRDRCG